MAAHAPAALRKGRPDARSSILTVPHLELAISMAAAVLKKKPHNSQRLSCQALRPVSPGGTSTRNPELTGPWRQHNAYMETVAYSSNRSAGSRCNVLRIRSKNNPGASLRPMRVGWRWEPILPGRRPGWGDESLWTTPAR